MLVEEPEQRSAVGLAQQRLLAIRRPVDKQVAQQVQVVADGRLLTVAPRPVLVRLQAAANLQRVVKSSARMPIRSRQVLFVQHVSIDDSSWVGRRGS